MKIKVIVFNKDRTTSVKILKKAERADKKFTINQCDYYIDPDCYVSTSLKKYYGLKKIYFFTLYYRAGDPQPLNAPEFGEQEGISGAEINQIFKPAFYRMLADTGQNKKQDWIFYLMLGNIALSLFIAWKVNSLGDMFKELATAVEEFFNSYQPGNAQAATPQYQPQPSYPAPTNYTVSNGQFGG